MEDETHGAPPEMFRMLVCLCDYVCVSLCVSVSVRACVRAFESGSLVTEPEWNLQKVLDYLEEHPLIDDDTGERLPSLKVFLNPLDSSPHSARANLRAHTDHAALSLLVPRDPPALAFANLALVPRGRPAHVSTL